MRDLFLDTFAWLEYFQGTAKGKRVRERLDEAQVAYTCPLVLAELYSKFARTHGEDDAARRVEFVLKQTAVIEHVADTGLEAGRIHAAMKARLPDFGMADAFVLAAARSRGAKILTGDPHFKDLDDAELL